MKIVISGTSFKQRVLKYKKKINSFIDRNIEDSYHCSKCGCTFYLNYSDFKIKTECDCYNYYIKIVYKNCPNCGLEIDFTKSIYFTLDDKAEVEQALNEIIKEKRNEEEVENDKID